MENKKLIQAKEILLEQLKNARNEYNEIESILERIWEGKVEMSKEERQKLSKKHGILNEATMSIPSMLSNLELLITGQHISPFDF